jgi:pimeloyl-ACP methyl ester carboxylesterase
MGTLARKTATLDGIAQDRRADGHFFPTLPSTFSTMIAGWQRFEVAIDGARLVGDVGGADGGPTLVFLHAGVADRRSWAGVVERLAEDFGIVVYDRRGFGDTLADQEPHAHLDDLVAVLDALDLRSVWLIGSSQGGRIAIDVALHSPPRVTGLVLVSPAISGAPGVDSYSGSVARLVNLLDEAEDSNDFEEINRLEAHLWLDGPDGPEGRLGEPIRSLFLDMNGRALALGERGVGVEREPLDAFGRLEDIGVPTLVVWGDRDLPHIQQRAAALAGRLPAATVWLAAGTAHLPYLEEPATFAAHVRQFVLAH